MVSGRMCHRSKRGALNRLWHLQTVCTVFLNEILRCCMTLDWMHRRKSTGTKPADVSLHVLATRVANDMRQCRACLSEGWPPGRVQMCVATPTDRHCSAACLAAAATSGKLKPSSAAAPAICRTKHISSSMAHLNMTSHYPVQFEMITM